MGEKKAGVNHCTSEQLTTSFTEHSEWQTDSKD